MTTDKKADIKVRGMVCAACTSTIEKSLRSLDGVSHAQVNLGTEIASLEYDPKKLKLSDLEKAVRDAGYDVIDEKVVLKIGGMVCAMCVEALETALKKLDGVTDVRINLASEKAYVTYNTRITSISDMKAAIEGTGYQYLGVAGDEATFDLEKEAREKDLKDKKQRIILGFATSLFLMGLMYLPLDRVVPMDILMALPAYDPMNLLMLVISAPAFVYISYPIFKAALRALRNRNLNMDVM
jgi:Cu+-exporting ATPase